MASLLARGATLNRCSFAFRSIRLGAEALLAKDETPHQFGVCTHARDLTLNNCLWRSKYESWVGRRLASRELMSKWKSRHNRILMCSLEIPQLSMHSSSDLFVAKVPRQFDPDNSKSQNRHENSDQWLEIQTRKLPPTQLKSWSWSANMAIPRACDSS
jgi:hypothetical protein